MGSVHESKLARLARTASQPGTLLRLRAAGEQDLGPIAACVAALCLSACVNLAPDYQRPAASVPATLPGVGEPAPSAAPAAPAASAAPAAPAATPLPAAATNQTAGQGTQQRNAAGTGGADTTGNTASAVQGSNANDGVIADAGTAATLELNDFFVDQRLLGVIRLALANNRDLRVAALNIERARAQYGVVRADAFPGVDAGIDAERARTINSSGVSSVGSTYGLSIGLTSYELDFFSRVKNLGEAALQTYLGYQETRRSSQITLVSSVAGAWLQLAADRQRLQLARITLESQRKSYDLIERSHALGAQSGVALAQAQSTVDAARVQVGVYDSQVEQDGNALALLVGSVPPADLLPAAETSVLAVPTARLLMPPADLPSSVLLMRPDVLAAEHTLIGSNADIGAARAAFYPRITLTGAGGTTSSSLSGLFGPGTTVWNFSPSISIPIFDGGANRANLQVAQAQQQIELATYEKTVQTAFREVADAFADRRTLSERVAAQQSLVAATQRSYDLSQALFRSGGAAFLDVLDAQRSLYSAQQTLIGLQLSEQANRVTLYKVLGGGWRAQPL
ncbi:MAG: efflux transporter outer membrane subunit [Janthinobacterium lividum]